MHGQSSLYRSLSTRYASPLCWCVARLASVRANPSFGPDMPSFDQDIPSLEPDIQSLEPDVPSLDHDIPSLDPDIQSLDPDIPSLDPDIPSLDPEIPSLDPDIYLVFSQASIHSCASAAPTSAEGLTLVHFLLDALGRFMDSQRQKWLRSS